MQVLTICSSPKSENSNTLKIVKPILSGMKSAGANYEIVDLAKLNIHHCIGCLACWLKTPGVCIYKDDMADILTKIVSADFIIFATPLYVYTLSGLMKNCLDRMMPLGSHFIEESTNAERISINHGGIPRKRQKMLLVASCGFPELSHFAALQNYFAFMSGPDKCDFDYLGAVLRPAASLLEDEHYQTQAKNYYENLAIAGKELVLNGAISTALHKKLHTLWIDGATYRKIVNQYFAELMQQDQQ